ncbi:aspartate-semialdehyde dehydrogenase [Pseudenhygromyxa sp. WMMC2535]|uniref:aspartate-semialdehyde dehydrogenase n=1 Tax=Pseudenhygromyxa sp. WMMC2535 TaxID=2712867 RepID=UPI00155655E6|nr:aspartate-semialdehyde dehydrogenase [Pseudenhygromyxa sp. WMMC2535]NVB39620.1 aspartate-semialdehyde dehydrogenase [Pseudenhygromyxa sp. WMMC2535]
MRICILGATGLVGRELLTLLDRAWPGAERVLYASRDQTLEHGGESFAVHAAAKLETEDAPRGDLAFVALDDQYSARYCPRLVDLGYRVIDKSNTYRMDPDVPLVVAGVNHRRVDDSVSLIANPNCTTIPLTLALEPLRARFGLGEVTVSSYQAISGAGVAALDDFIAQTAAGFAAMAESGDRLGEGLDAANYPGNTVPHAGKTDDSGFSSEERKLINESRKILELPELGIGAQCCRVPVTVGHYENVWLELREPTTAEAIAEVLRVAPFVSYLPGAEGAELTALATLKRRDSALVGRLRRDNRDQDGRRWCLTVAADNLRLGAATNAVRAGSAWFGGEDPSLRV